MLTEMNFYFNSDLASGYKSNSQKIRVMSENWLSCNMFCPACGNIHISKLSNNMPVADLKCDRCGEIYELKSVNGKIGRKISDGAYSTMIERITGAGNPDLFIMEYSREWQVVNLTLIPRFFFTPSIIEKRKPLSAQARRAGWVGCNILYSAIPDQGKITIIKNQEVMAMESVVESYARVRKLQIGDIKKRSWLLDVLSCVNAISKDDFSLGEMYKFADILQANHISNHNIEAKIRQQLQILRDAGFIEFLGRGRYRKIPVR